MRSRFSRSPNWREGAFHNVDEAPHWNRTLGFLKWKLLDRSARRRLRHADGAPRVEPDLARLRSPGFEGITWLGHATALIQLGGVNLLTDPIWGSPAGYPCRIVPHVLPIAELPAIHAVLISHDHRDHLDGRSVRGLGRAPLYAVPLGVERFLRRRRVTRVASFDWWDAHEMNGLRITFVPAHHWSQRGLARNRSLWGGWVIESPRATVYFSGDTARMPVLRHIGRRFPGIDYALLSVGAYEPRWFMKRVHMNPEEAVEVFLDLGARHLIPVHWGTMRLGDEPPTEPPARLAREFAGRRLPADALRVLAIGETLPIPSRPRR